VYKVTAYDADGKEIASDSITVRVKAGSSETTDTNNNSSAEDSASSTDLTLTFPVPNVGSVYETTLSPITIGGTASADIRNIYINDNPLQTHALGNTSWSYNYTLQPGVNEIKVYGENELNDQTPLRTLTIDYKVNN
jgi:hypothetical protein